MKGLLSFVILGIVITAGCVIQNREPGSSNSELSEQAAKRSLAVSICKNISNDYIESDFQSYCIAMVTHNLDLCIGKPWMSYCTLSIVTNEAVNKRDPSLCKDPIFSTPLLKKRKLSDWCYIRYALTFKNESFCDEVMDLDHRAICLAVISGDNSLCPKHLPQLCNELVAVSLGNATFCSTLISSTSTISCFRLMAQTSKDPSLCEKMKDEPEYGRFILKDDIAECYDAAYMSVAVSSRTPSFCRRMTHEDKRTMCSAIVGVDAKLCQHLPRSERINCKFSIAMSIADIKVLGGGFYDNLDVIRQLHLTRGMLNAPASNDTLAR